MPRAMWLRKFDFDLPIPTLNIVWRKLTITAIIQKFGFVGTEVYLVRSVTSINGTLIAFQPRDESSGFNNLLLEILKQMRCTRAYACFEKGIEKSKLAFFNDKNYKKLWIKSI